MVSTRIDREGIEATYAVATPPRSTSHGSRRERWQQQRSNGRGRGIESGRRIVHFPWQISYLMKYIVHDMPAFLSDRVAAKAARRH